MKRLLTLFLIFLFLLSAGCEKEKDEADNTFDTTEISSPETTSSMPFGEIDYGAPVR